MTHPPNTTHPDTSFGTLLSVNAGEAAPMTVQGETLLTGFDKRPAHGTMRVEAGGLLQDDHVDDALDPDRALLCYQRRHYDLWERELGRRLPPGTFGENLTIEGPADEEVMLGDELTIGTVHLRVTQPRIPCRKMAVRLGEEDFPARYLRSGRLGFFCRVLEPGPIRPGDPIRLRRRGDDDMSVADLARFLHLERPDTAGLHRVLACSALPPALRTKAGRRLGRAQGEDAVWSGDRTLVVTGRRQEAAEVVSFELADPGGARLPDFEAGQFLTLSLDVPGAGRPVVRTYTLVGRSEDGHGYRIAVKREPAPPEAPGVPAGAASGHLHTQVEVGSLIPARAPRGRFVVEPGDRPVVLLSAGIGITPMIAMLERIAERTPERPVFFLHGARSSHQLAFGPYLRRLVASGARLHSHLMFSRPAPDDVPGRDFDGTGRLTPAVLAHVLPSLEADYYLCGPGDFMRDMVTGLTDRGVPADRVRFEFFGAARPRFGDDGTETEAGPVALDAEGRPLMVTFARSGIAVPWRENTFSLLALAEQAGLRPEASCRTGLCGTCVSGIDDGEVEYAIDPMDEAQPGRVTVCCARPTTSVMLDL